MAAVPLKDILARTQQMKEQERLKQGQEHWTMEQFKQYKTGLDQTNKTMEKVEQASLETKDNTAETNKELKKIGEILKKPTTPNQPKRVEEHTPKEGAEVEPVKGKYYKGFKGAVGDITSSFKKMGTLEGWIDVDKSSGVMGEILKKRRAKKEWIQDELRINPGTTRAEAAAKFEAINKARGQEEKRTAEVERLRTSGRSEEEIGKLGLLTPIGDPTKMAAPLAAVEAAKGNLLGGEEAQMEGQRSVDEQTESLKNIEKNTADIPELVKAVKENKPQAPGQPAKEEGKGSGFFESLGGGIKGVGKKLLGAGRGLLNVGRAGLALVGGGSAAMGAAVVGGGLLAGYAGKKFRERVEAKEAENQKSYEAEIAEKGVDVGAMKGLPDDGNAWKPSDVREASRLRNLAEIKVQQKGSFTEQEAALTKQKLGVEVPKELIGAKDAHVASEASKSDYSKSVIAEFSEDKFSQADPDNYAKFVEFRNNRAQEILDKQQKDIESTKYKTPRDKEIAITQAKSPAAKRNAYMKAGIEAQEKFSKEIQAAGAGKVTVKETGEKAAQASKPTSQTGSTALQQAEAAVGGVKTGEIVAGASMTGAGINQQVGLTQAGVERNAEQPAEPVIKAPATLAQVQGATQTGPGKYEGTLSGVSEDVIKSNPNYQKYYEQALHGRTGPDAERMARKSAWMRVQGDMVKAAAPAPTAADAVYGKSAENKAAEQSSSSVVNAPIINAPSTSVQQTTNNATYKPARNSESSQQWYNRTRYSF